MQVEERRGEAPAAFSPALLPVGAARSCAGKAGSAYHLAQSNNLIEGNFIDTNAAGSGSRALAARRRSGGTGLSLCASPSRQPDRAGRLNAHPAACPENRE